MQGGCSKVVYEPNLLSENARVFAINDLLLFLPKDYKPWKMTNVYFCEFQKSTFKIPSVYASSHQSYSTLCVGLYWLGFGER